MSAAPSHEPIRSHVVGVLVEAEDQIVGARIRQLLSRADSGSAGDAGPTLAVVVSRGDATAVRRAAKAHPGVPLIAVMPSDTSGSALRRAMRDGAEGIVLECDLESGLEATARAVTVGQIAVPQVMRRQIAPRALSYREKQILAYVVRGYTNRQIADELFVAESTVKSHLSSAF